MSLCNRLGRLWTTAALVGMVVYGFVGAVVISSYALALAAATSAALFTSIFTILATSALQIEVPDPLRARVMGIHAIAYSLMPLGGLLLGGGATYVGVANAVAISVSVYLIVVLAVVQRVTSVRRLNADHLSAS